MRRQADAEEERRRQKQEEERKKKEEEQGAKAAKAAEEAAAREREKNEREKADISPTLSVSQYKALWASLGTAGSFQCKLKSAPSLIAFSEHLRKQGFHVVFAASPSTTDIEVGICNIRADGTGDWFLARFLASQSTFSAVMKCQNNGDVSAFVKRFALAKVLKIDTSK